VNSLAPSAPWVVDVVRVQAERAGIPVTQGGYRIHTTIDPQMQAAAQRAVSNGLDDIESRPGFRGVPCAAATPIDSARNRRAKVQACLEGAAVVLDPATGDVRALVGGRNYARSSFNRAVDGNRQPGSSFKAFVYAQALTQGLTASSLVADTALHIRLQNGQMYSPDNADNVFLVHSLCAASPVRAIRSRCSWRSASAWTRHRVGATGGARRRLHRTVECARRLGCAAARLRGGVRL
jgi:penicillin-binding protein 1A